MSAHPIIELRCDEPGCDRMLATGQQRVGNARAEACGAGGWSSEVKRTPGRAIRTLDYCPDHGPGAPR